ncbi:MAG: hypothetical protein ACR2MO_05865 [Acidimicrobiales bacterium]
MLVVSAGTLHEADDDIGQIAPAAGGIVPESSGACAVWLAATIGLVVLLFVAGRVGGPA